jgi:hypothetical protein
VSKSVDNDVSALQLLPYTHGAEYKAFECLNDKLPHNALCHEGTSVALLEKITAWMAVPDTHHVFWLYGLARTSKSTIARTIKRCCANLKRLGAGFFLLARRRQPCQRAHVSYYRHAAAGGGRASRQAAYLLGGGRCARFGRLGAAGSVGEACAAAVGPSRPLDAAAPPQPVSYCLQRIGRMRSQR